MNSKLAIFPTESSAEQCHQLAARTGIPLYDAVSRELEPPQFLLQYQPGLVLVEQGPKAPGPITVDFTQGKQDHRRRQGGGEQIVKAVSGKGSRAVSVIDLTAGLGRDSFVLASHGCQVTAVERSALVFALLEDGLQRAAHSGLSKLEAIVGRMQLRFADGRDYLASLTEEQRPDAIYLDPMFPESRKSALVKKEMRAFHQLVGEDLDSSELLSAALERVRHRVVVKRPLKAPVLADRQPNFSLKGKAIRFDIYSVARYPD